MLLHVLVRGRVQGVGFRWYVREVARDLGLAGWVRNRPDGTVEVVADGERRMLERLREMLREGPDGAAVSSVDEIQVSAGDGDDALAQPFTILR